MPEGFGISIQWSIDQSKQPGKAEADYRQTGSKNIENII